MISAVFIAASSVARSDEVAIDFGNFEQGTLPEDAPFKPALPGNTRSAGNWEIVMGKVPPTLEPFFQHEHNPVDSTRPVLAQTKRTAKQDHYPLLIYDPLDFKNFTLTTRFKIKGGALAQTAGIAFRLQDPKNYYVLRASAYEKTIRFYKYVDGRRGPLIGPEKPVESGVWYRLKIKCSGNQIDCWLDGDRIMPTLNDNTFSEGKIGFWTKADSISYFTGLRVTYQPRVSLAQRMVEKALERYSRLEGLEIYSYSPNNPQIRLIASKGDKTLGKPASDVEKDVIENGTIYYGDNYNGDNSVASVVYPLDDRNGAPIAAVRFIIDSFPGQTEKNALAKARPIKRYLESLVGRADYLTRD